MPLFLSLLFDPEPALLLSASVEEGFVVVDEVLLELPLLAGELEELAGLDALLGVDELPLDLEAAGLEVVFVDEELVDGLAVADDVAGDTLVVGVAVPIGAAVAVALGEAVAVAVAVAVAAGVAVAVGAGDAVAVAVAIGDAVALAAGEAVGAVWPAIPVCVVTPLRPPPPRLMLMPAAGWTP